MRDKVARFNQSYMPEPNSGCWIWTGRLKKSRDVRGVLRINSKDRQAHRLSYEIHFGEIPVGMCVCHKCDVTTCVNPDHLFLGTHTDNMQDCARKGRKSKHLVKFGDDNVSSKLTDEQVSEIKSLRFGPTYYAKKFGVHPVHVGAIQRGKKRTSILATVVYERPKHVQTEQQKKRAAYMREWRRRSMEPVHSGDCA